VGIKPVTASKTTYQSRPNVQRVARGFSQKTWGVTTLTTSTYRTKAVKVVTTVMASDLTAIAAVQKQLDDMKCQFSQEAVQVCEMSGLLSPRLACLMHGSLCRCRRQTAKATYDAALDDGTTAREVRKDVLCTFHTSVAVVVV
jgi:hypothetical protein